MTLVTFNTIFAVENALDLIFLWSGAALPATITLADYAHRGAYTLIATALLAATFVVVALNPGSGAAKSTWLRRLVVLWIAQNVMLVASSILRLIDYIDAFSLTVLRISALVWMFLVAVGLVLICWRMLAAKSAAWLINATTAVAFMVLGLCSVIDLGATAASWNVRHARDARDLDLCYLQALGPSALLPLIDLERRAGSTRLRDRATFLRTELRDDLRASQADWHQWTFRNARRLSRADALLGPNPRQPLPAPNGRACDGAISVPPPPPAPDAPAALTGAPQQ